MADRPAEHRPAASARTPAGWPAVAALLGLVVAATTLVGLSTQAWGSAEGLAPRAWWERVVDDGWPRGGWPGAGWPGDGRAGSPPSPGHPGYADGPSRAG
ncbi:hypothetical protein Cfla_3235 [Cellulomonas flavigena DSM 20109]|uniref:Uncharacterized protein n=1 Tax=Cellulomonas flavigena (strain ATCC 482 / DSM 20109 / BCRC 11376 / JCM 18109 / NBRC 3775 / NCIMB 8073 / NRS 134) TaxID=446466 RepID=D5UBV8_CELFN|nr:hypothetical protein [Cellulomonas flavigena]ADG76117.1 hypothetical protein Cfla_3235 [Cellulomonas flavigena DSM 20109]